MIDYIMNSSLYIGIPTLFINYDSIDNIHETREKICFKH